MFLRYCCDDSLATLVSGIHKQVQHSMFWCSLALMVLVETTADLSCVYIPQGWSTGIQLRTMHFSLLAHFLEQMV